MSKQKWEGGTLLAPVPPVMVSCGDGEKSNILTIAWTGIVNSTPPKTYISVRPQRYSYEIIRRTREFMINLTSHQLLRAADYCGIFTGAKVDKFSKCGLTKEFAESFACPMIAESPLSLACRVTDIIPMGSHDMFLADIEVVFVREDLIDEAGKMRLGKAGLVAYSHGEYFALGKRLGKFGFSAKKKRSGKNTGSGGK